MNLETIQKLKFMQARVALLNGLTASDRTLFAANGRPLKDVLTDSLAELSAAEKAEQIASWKQAITDPVKRAELCAFRTTVVDSYVRATSKYASLFFRPVNLGDSERPVLQNTYRSEIKVTYLAEDGGPKVIKALKPQKQTFTDLRVLSTEEFGYHTRDIYQGDISAAAQATVDMAYDMANKVDAEAYGLMTSGTTLYGAFTTTGTKLSRTWVANSRVVAANLPSTNELSASSNGANTKFRLDCCRQIVRYCEGFADIFGAPIRPTGVILVPSVDAADLADEIVPTGSTNNAIADGILANYSQFSYMKVNWTIVPDATIASGYCYPVLNRPVGEIYFKPSMDEEFVTTDQKKHWESRVQNKVVGFSIPEPWRVFACRVHYKS